MYIMALLLSFIAVHCSGPCPHVSHTCPEFVENIYKKLLDILPHSIKGMKIIQSGIGLLYSTFKSVSLLRASVNHTRASQC